MFLLAKTTLSVFMDMFCRNLIRVIYIPNAVR